MQFRVSVLWPCFRVFRSGSNGFDIHRNDSDKKHAKIYITPSMGHVLRIFCQKPFVTGTLNGVVQSTCCHSICT